MISRFKMMRDKKSLTHTGGEQFTRCLYIGGLVLALSLINVPSVQDANHPEYPSRSTKAQTLESIPAKPSNPHTIMNSRFRRGKKAELLLQPVIHKVARRHQVDPAMVKAIIFVESSYNPRAISNKGARGLMQLMPRTANALGVEDSFHPEDNINGGVKYFKQLLDQFHGDIRLALAAYNAGASKVRKYGGIPPYKATRCYVEKVFKYYEQYKKGMEENSGSFET